MYKQILVATDGSKLSAKAIAQAIDLAQALGAKLTAFYASPDYPLPAYADGVPTSRCREGVCCTVQERGRGNPHHSRHEGRVRRA